MFAERGHTYSPTCVTRALDVEICKLHVCYAHVQIDVLSSTHLTVTGYDLFQNMLITQTYMFTLLCYPSSNIYIYIYTYITPSTRPQTVAS